MPNNRRPVEQHHPRTPGTRRFLESLTESGRNYWDSTEDHPKTAGQGARTSFKTLDLNKIVMLSEAKNLVFSIS